MDNLTTKMIDEIKKAYLNSLINNDIDVLNWLQSRKKEEIQEKLERRIIAYQKQLKEEWTE